MLKLCSFSEVDLDDLLESVTKEVVVVNLVSDLELGLVEVDLSLSALSRGLSLALGVSLDRRVQNLVQLRLALRDNISSPLAQVLQVVDQLELVELHVGAIDLPLLLIDALAAGLLREQIGKL